MVVCNKLLITDSSCLVSPDVLATLPQELCLTMTSLGLCRTVVAAAQSNASVIASIGAMHEAAPAGSPSTAASQESHPSESCSADKGAVDTESSSSAPEVSEADAMSVEEDNFDDDDEGRDMLGSGILRPRPSHRLEQRIELIVPSHAEPWVVAQVMATGPQALLMQLATELTAHTQLGSGHSVDSSKQCAWQPGVKSESAEANKGV